MGIKYREDPHLDFLGLCESEDLKILVEILSKARDGKERWTTSLLSENEFEKCRGDYKKIWKLIAGELQLYGGDSIANTLRRSGVLYSEILEDICGLLEIDYKGILKWSGSGAEAFELAIGYL